MISLNFETIYCDKHGTYQGPKLWIGRIEMEGRCPGCVIDEGAKRRKALDHLSAIRSWLDDEKLA